jgi:hypothetical protein
MTYWRNDLYYLRRIHRRIREHKSLVHEDTLSSLGGVTLADEIDWLECFIDKIVRKKK